MYNTYGTYNLGTTNALGNSMSGSLGSMIWTIIALILSIVGAFVVYFIFVKNKKSYAKKFVAWLKSFLDFQEMLIEPILKISYIFTALFITLGSFALIGNFVAFLATLICGNIVARVIYEFMMLTISIWQNTRDINKKMK